MQKAGSNGIELLTDQPQRVGLSPAPACQLLDHEDQALASGIAFDIARRDTRDSGRLEASGECPDVQLQLLQRHAGVAPYELGKTEMIGWTGHASGHNMITRSRIAQQQG
jgi:hypothetical protein